MKGIILTDQNSDGIAVEEVTLPPLDSDEVRVKVHCAALNHRDQWCREGRYPNIKYGTILGSDGAGEVVEVGEKVDSKWIGQMVLINAAAGWGTSEKAQSSDFEILGMPNHGTLAEYVQVKADRLEIKPDYLSMEEASAIPLAGLTAHRALFFQGDVTAGDKVLVTGFGGGVAQFAVQFALKAGAKVYASSGDERKLQIAHQYGVTGGFNYRDENWASNALKEGGGFDLIIDSAVGNTLNTLIKTLKPGGKLVVYGATLGNPDAIDMRRVFWNQLTIQGTTMGTDKDFKEMISFISLNKIKPIIDSVYPMADAIQAFDKMKEGKQMGKIIVKMV